jgi:HSP20 family protein
MKTHGTPETPPTERTSEQPVLTPLVDIIERETALYLVADMPGVDESTLDIKVERNVLSLTGRVVAAAPEGREPLRTEFAGGEYARSFTLSNEIDQTGIEATLRDGVLHLTLPKAKEAKPRRIEVKAG